MLRYLHGFRAHMPRCGTEILVGCGGAMAGPGLACWLGQVGRSSGSHTRDGDLLLLGRAGEKEKERRRGGLAGWLEMTHGLSFLLPFLFLFSHTIPRAWSLSVRSAQLNAA
jgi:hypothetical protein